MSGILAPAKLRAARRFLELGQAASTPSRHRGDQHRRVGWQRAATAAAICARRLHVDARDAGR
jgi:hypothetical protein